MRNTFKKVFSVFRKTYIKIPLEVYKAKPYETLISTLLSSRTRDEVTLKAAIRLFRKAPNISELRKLRIEETKKLIYPVGFYKTKAKHLKKLAWMVLARYKGKIPNTREELMKLPGVGRKTANLVLNRAFRKHAIAVDTHVHKISNMLGWVNTKTPQTTEKELVKILPKRYWSDINRLFVSIGRQYNTKYRLKEFLIKNRLIRE